MRTVDTVEEIDPVSVKTIINRKTVFFMSYDTLCLQMSTVNRLKSGLSFL